MRTEDFLSVLMTMTQLINICSDTIAKIITNLKYKEYYLLNIPKQIQVCKT